MSRPGFDHEEWDALAVGWALSALDAEDGERFADHLPGCDRCTATVRESLYTVADLAYATPDEAPPPALKSRLMAAVAAEPRSVPVPLDEEWPLGAPHPGTPGYDAEWSVAEPAPSHHARSEPSANGPFYGGDHRRDDGPAGAVEHIAGPRARSAGRHAAPEPDGDADGVVVPLDRRRRWARRLTVASAAAAALAVLAGLGAWNLQLRSERDDLRQVAAQRDNLQQVVAQRDAALAQLTTNGPARVAALAPFGKPTDPRQATLVVRGAGQVEIIVEGLPETAGNQRYWLWTLRCDTPQPSDLRPIRGFQVSQSAFSVRSIGSDPGLATATCFAISREVGTATPTVPREVVLAGQPG